LATVATEDGLVSVIAPEDLRVSGGALEDGVFQLSLPTVSGRQYVLEFTDELPGTNWTELQLIDGDGTVRVLVDFSATNHQRFYRVRAN
jgi:hypothetical protein